MMRMIASGMVITGAERCGKPKSAVQPFIVVTGKYHLRNRYQESNLPGDSAIATTHNSWTDNETRLE
ncbi:hypothetical protein HZ326_22869 [Fusarium oxysporum f. sp. albedinis]|nr:hypothetical protein HZ326_22869 [Fusarium oxysporum f. sp. albedinis]